MGKDSPNNAPPDSELSRISGPYLPLQAPARRAIKDYGINYRAGDPYKFGPDIATNFNQNQRRGQQGALNIAGGNSSQYFNPFLNQLGGYATQDPTGRGLPGTQFYDNAAAGRYNNPATASYNNIYGQAQAGQNTDQAFNTLNQFAGGEFVGKNPYLDAIYGQGAKALKENFQESVNPTIEGLLTRTGGGGGSVETLLKGQAQRELGTSLEDLNTKIYGGAYDQDVNRMLSASQSLPGLEGQRINTLLNAAGGQFQAGQQNFQNRLTGIEGKQGNQQNAFLQSLQAGGQLGPAYQQQFAPFDIFNQIGGQQQQNQERMNAEDQDRFRFQQDAPFQEINRYVQGLQGIAALSPNSSAAAASFANGQQGGPSAFQQFVGNTTGLLGAAAPIAGAAFGPGGYFAARAAGQLGGQLSGGSGTDQFRLI